MEIESRFDGIISALRAKGEMRLMPKASKESIEAFESGNGVSLPEGYKEWLRISDGGDLFLPAGIQLYGVARKPLIDPDDEDRPGEGYVVIGALSTGEPILCENGSEGISVYNSGAGRIENDEIFADFFEFIGMLAQTLGIED